MSNLDDFSNEFQSVWVGLRDQREKYEKRVSQLEPYRGSAGYDKEMAEAEKEYADNVMSIQDDAVSVFNGILRRMHERVSPVNMDVPTNDQIKLLQVLALRDRLDSRDIELAAASLRESDTAMAALADIALRCGMVIPASYKSMEEQRRAAYESLRESVNGLVRWNGSDGDSVRSEWSYNRSPYNPDADRSKLNPYTFTSARIADMGGDDMQGMRYKRTTYELCRELVDDDVPWDAVSGLA